MDSIRTTRVGLSFSFVRGTTTVLVSFLSKCLKRAPFSLDCGGTIRSLFGLLLKVKQDHYFPLDSEGVTTAETSCDI